MTQRNGLFHRTLSVHFDEEFLVHVLVRQGREGKLFNKTWKVAVCKRFGSAQLSPSVARCIAHVHDDKRIGVGEDVDFRKKLTLDGDFHRLRVEGIDKFAGVVRHGCAATQKLYDELDGLWSFFLKDGTDWGWFVSWEVLEASNCAGDGEIRGCGHVRIDGHVVIVD